MNNILIPIHQHRKIKVHRPIPTHVQNEAAIRPQPNEKVNPDQVDIHTIHQEHQLPVLARADTAIAQHRPVDYHMAPLTDIIRTMFKERCFIHLTKNIF